MSAEELTPLGVELARVILLVDAVIDLVDDPGVSKRGRLERVLPARKRRAAA